MQGLTKSESVRERTVQALDAEDADELGARRAAGLDAGGEAKPRDWIQDIWVKLDQGRTNISLWAFRKFAPQRHSPNLGLRAGQVLIAGLQRPPDKEEVARRFLSTSSKARRLGLRRLEDPQANAQRTTRCAGLRNTSAQTSRVPPETPVSTENPCHKQMSNTSERAAAETPVRDTVKAHHTARSSHDLRGALSSHGPLSQLQELPPASSISHANGAGVKPAQCLAPVLTWPPASRGPKSQLLEQSTVHVRELLAPSSNSNSLQICGNSKLPGLANRLLVPSGFKASASAPVTANFGMTNRGTSLDPLESYIPGLQPASLSIPDDEAVIPSPATELGRPVVLYRVRGTIVAHYGPGLEVLDVVLPGDPVTLTLTRLPETCTHEQVLDLLRRAGEPVSLSMDTRTGHAPSATATYCTFAAATAAASKLKRLTIDGATFMTSIPSAPQAASKPSTFSSSTVKRAGAQLRLTVESSKGAVYQRSSAMNDHGLWSFPTCLLRYQQAVFVLWRRLNPLN
ncbi:hypothetical protein AURDEDRAFT_131929 [Auricularia subglabra TFB-10046 SS5]|uniref:RRM domain-containing protein n=1 Tax=Auricularia subglabra (strain TFB-10046 / SS5) TaxID=717982 RepID=J0WMB9_AURST|nr:hypothetical protein AURDEDRAFT_131929 [Auricularia subglabra TFB-10046 SS5]